MGEYAKWCMCAWGKGGEVWVWYMPAQTNSPFTWLNFGVLGNAQLYAIEKYDITMTSHHYDIIG